MRGHPTSNADVPQRIHRIAKRKAHLVSEFTTNGMSLGYEPFEIYLLIAWHAPEVRRAW